MRVQIFLFVLILMPMIIYAQLSPSKGDYYTVDVKTPKNIYIADSSEASCSLEAGTVIKIRSVENDEIYFQITNNEEDTKSGVLYYISRLDFTEKYFSSKFYVRGGVLVTPFKYRPDKSKFYPGGNIAAAGSFSYNILGVSLQPLFFAGLTAISVSDLNAGEVNTETKWGFTAGMGINFDIYEAFNVGFVSGWDMIDSSWESNGKIWLALSFNYKLFE
jgi:hypothetical protein